MIGTKFNKPLANPTEYTAAANWCNENGAMIVDQGDYYEVTAIPPPAPPSIEQQIVDLETLITLRRLREASLGIDNGWMADLDAQIASLRAQLPESQVVP